MRVDFTRDWDHRLPFARELTAIPVNPGDRSNGCRLSVQIERRPKILSLSTYMYMPRIPCDAQPEDSKTGDPVLSKRMADVIELRLGSVIFFAVLCCFSECREKRKAITPKDIRRFDCREGDRTPGFPVCYLVRRLSSSLRREEERTRVKAGKKSGIGNEIRSRLASRHLILTPRVLGLSLDPFLAVLITIFPGNKGYGAGTSHREGEDWVWRGG